MPAAVFSLKSLTSLDVSNNKLQVLPVEMWTSPKLKEFNIAFNLLSELPQSATAAAQTTNSRLSDTEPKHETLSR